MKYTVQYPMQDGYDRRLLDPATMIRFAVEAERAGFDAIAFTEHPVPSQKWLSAGGHESLDPLTALSFVAAATSKLRLMTYLLVLPYRNPFLAAKQASTVDVVSGGRLTLALGTGYLRSEFRALGVDFERRNALFDEAIEVMTGIWQHADFHYDGANFVAGGQTQRPAPVQLPHPPLWLGGNSVASQRRVARFGQGWTPLIVDGPMTTTARTPPIASPAAFKDAVDRLRQMVSDAGRDPDEIDVQAEWAPARHLGPDVEVVRDAVGQLESAGATWAVFEPSGVEAEAAIEAVQSYGRDVIRYRSQ